jgi:hypothetical protein
VLLALLFVLTLICVLLFAAHVSRHRRVAFEISLARLISISLEIEGGRDANTALGHVPRDE